MLRGRKFFRLFRRLLSAEPARDDASRSRELCLIKIDQKVPTVKQRKALKKCPTGSGFLAIS
jgi:hypothetical protein